MLKLIQAQVSRWSLCTEKETCKCLLRLLRYFQKWVVSLAGGRAGSEVLKSVNKLNILMEEALKSSRGLFIS